MNPVDLEDLAVGYRQRPTSVAALARAERAAEMVELAAGDVALDIGGGRGHHAGAWARHSARSVVIDASRGMVQSAGSQPGVKAICAYSQAIPLIDSCARLAYFHLSLHYGDWRASLDEVARVLRPGGECWIWTMGEAHHRASFLAQWFPSVGDIDAGRFPDPAAVVRYLDSMALVVETGVETETKTMPAGDWRKAAAARFVSTLQLIPADELARGLSNFDIAHPDKSEPVEYVLTFDWIRAQF